MSVKLILSEYGMTTYQALASIPILIGIITVLLKLLKKPFMLIDLISRNKFIILPIKDKADAIEIIYTDIDPDKKSEIYARDIKLADYGLRYPITTLRTTFDYLYSIEKLSTPIYINDFLKHPTIFISNKNHLPTLSLRGLSSSLSYILILFSLSITGLITGINSLTEILNSEANWNSVIRLAFFCFSNILFFTMNIVFATEIYSTFNAIRFLKKLKEYNKEQVYKKFKK